MTVLQKNKKSEINYDRNELGEPSGVIVIPEGTFVFHCKRIEELQTKVHVMWLDVDIDFDRDINIHIESSELIRSVVSIVRAMVVEEVDRHMKDIWDIIIP